MDDATRANEGAEDDTKEPDPRLEWQACFSSFSHRSLVIFLLDCFQVMKHFLSSLYDGPQNIILSDTLPFPLLLFRRMATEATQGRNGHRSSNCDVLSDSQLF